MFTSLCQNSSTGSLTLLQVSLTDNLQLPKENEILISIFVILNTI
jgi:hypothetical protein